MLKKMDKKQFKHFSEMNSQAISIIAAILFMAFVGPCFADYRISSAHTPSSTLQGTGSVSLGTIEYAPTGATFNPKKNLFCFAYKVIEGGFTETRENCVDNYEILKQSKGVDYEGIRVNGSRYRLDLPISEYVKTALNNELKFIGYKYTMEGHISTINYLRCGLSISKIS